MKNNVLVIAAATGMLLASCSKKEKSAEITTSEVTKTEIKTDSTCTESGIDDGHNAQNSLDWAGIYEGTVPCADCPGIKTTITLNDNGSFAITEEYLERKTKSEDKGKFEWDKSGSRITINGKDTKRQYFVGENQLFQLDTEGKEITGPNKDLYILKKEIKSDLQSSIKNP